MCLNERRFLFKSQLIRFIVVYLQRFFSSMVEQKEKQDRDACTHCIEYGFRKREMSSRNWDFMQFVCKCNKYAENNCRNSTLP